MLSFSLSTTEIAGIFLALMGAMLTFCWWLARQMVSQFERRLEARFDHVDTKIASLQELVSERHQHLSADHQDEHKRIEVLNNSLMECRQRCTVTFVTTAEFYEVIGPIQSRLDKLTERVTDVAIANRSNS